MIAVRFPPALSRNIKGTISWVPCFFDILTIRDEDNESDTLSIIKDACFNILQTNKYPSIINLMVGELAEGFAYLQFQIPFSAIDQDRIMPDNTPITYWGIFEYYRVSKEELNAFD